MILLKSHVPDIIFTDYPDLILVSVGLENLEICCLYKLHNILSMVVKCQLFIIIINVNFKNFMQESCNFFFGKNVCISCIYLLTKIYMQKCLCLVSIKLSDIQIFISYVHYLFCSIRHWICLSSPFYEVSSCWNVFPAGSVPDDEWNLLYVAVTRAKKCLVMTKSIENLLTLAGVSGRHHWL